MAKIENRSERQFHITGLPTTDAKGNVTPGTTYTISAKAPGINGAAGTGEIPDAVLADLLEKDVWTKAVFASDLAVVKGSEKAKAEPETEAESAHKAKGHTR